MHSFAFFPWLHELQVWVQNPLVTANKSLRSTCRKPEHNQALWQERLVGNAWVTLKINLFSIWQWTYRLKEKKEAGPKLLRTAEFIAAAKVNKQREQEYLCHHGLRPWGYGRWVGANGISLILQVWCQDGDRASVPLMSMSRGSWGQFCSGCHEMTATAQAHANSAPVWEAADAKVDYILWVLQDKRKAMRN